MWTVLEEYKDKKEFAPFDQKTTKYLENCNMRSMKQIVSSTSQPRAVNFCSQDDFRVCLVIEKLIKILKPLKNTLIQCI